MSSQVLASLQPSRMYAFIHKHMDFHQFDFCHNVKMESTLAKN